MSRVEMEIEVTSTKVVRYRVQVDTNDKNYEEVYGESLEYKMDMQEFKEMISENNDTLVDIQEIANSCYEEEDKIYIVKCDE